MPILFYILFLLALATTVLLVVLYIRFYYNNKILTLQEKLFLRTEELIREKSKTENLLSRVLPRDTARELIKQGRIDTQKFQMVTVLFADIQGFTKISEETNADSLIDQLDKLFYQFDLIVEKYGIEKIKTIGDAYMCAGGLPHPNRTNPLDVVAAAVEMLGCMDRINKQHPKKDFWELRIGIDTGPVVAGIVGRNKLAYDIWGTTVNIASRMESSSEPGKINISENTYFMVRDLFKCTPRGKIPIKNKGDVNMYFVEGFLPKFSKGNKYTPNDEFKTELQLIRLGDLEEFVFEKLEKGLPKNLYYHNLKHTVDVYTQVELIGRAEKISNKEMLLLKTAALFHDMGHLIDYATHEEMSIKLAYEILPRYGYSQEQISKIAELIAATKLPPKPKNLLEEIICDADLDYLGRTDFIPVSNALYKELHEHGLVGSLHHWNSIQIEFIQNHQYFTKTARRLRNVNKDVQLQKLKQWMKELENNTDL
ncbi:MAG: adenylate cyclase [Tenuifilum sp.]|jgi:class 3 adenylate cyclase|uniref:adenylate/guanylate cyclase domain-containing protein n=1 Tax=Tenuifilum sp. TaxID=2760880 RepID=UPI0024AB51EA|nr:adenylate/guanylate cyclase domain-containing protein [Tenuifilum sp.]MDI3526224.1 adenylate cyclase [Tenuifilum sp.]